MEELLQRARETRHIILTGPRGTGKSTLLQRLLACTDLPVTGFYTKKGEPDCSGLCRSYLYSASDPLRENSDVNCIGTCDNRTMLSCFPRVFDTLGVRYLREPGELTIMDEIGFMESQAELFQKEILNRLEGDAPVLAVVKDKDVPFLRTLKDHPNAACFTVSPDDRDDIFALLSPLVSAF